MVLQLDRSRLVTGSCSDFYSLTLYVDTFCFSFHCETAHTQDITVWNHKKTNQNPNFRGWQNLNLIGKQTDLSRKNSDLHGHSFSLCFPQQHLSDKNKILKITVCFSLTETKVLLERHLLSLALFYTRNRVEQVPYFLMSFILLFNGLKTHFSHWRTIRCLRTSGVPYQPPQPTPHKTTEMLCS